MQNQKLFKGCYQWLQYNFITSKVFLLKYKFNLSVQWLLTTLDIHTHDVLLPTTLFFFYPNGFPSAPMTISGKVIISTLKHLFEPDQFYEPLSYFLNSWANIRPKVTCTLYTLSKCQGSYLSAMDLSSLWIIKIEYLFL